jgi:hypothetical protein
MTDGRGEGNSALTEYSDLLSRCKFVLCPPGNFSNESFRYYEAIVLGSIPIVSSATIQDFTNFDYWPNRYSKRLKNASHYYTISEMLKLNERERAELAINIRNEFRSKCNALSRKIIELDSLIYPGINL